MHFSSVTKSIHSKLAFLHDPKIVLLLVQFLFDQLLIPSNNKTLLLSNSYKLILHLSPFNGVKLYLKLPESNCYLDLFVTSSKDY